jgi:hypothetical protein
MTKRRRARSNTIWNSCVGRHLIWTPPQKLYVMPLFNFFWCGTCMFGFVYIFVFIFGFVNSYIWSSCIFAISIYQLLLVWSLCGICVEFNFIWCGICILGAVVSSQSESSTVCVLQCEDPRRCVRVLSRLRKSGASRSRNEGAFGSKSTLNEWTQRFVWSYNVPYNVEKSTYNKVISTRDQPEIIAWGGGPNDSSSVRIRFHCRN